MRRYDSIADSPDVRVRMGRFTIPRGVRVFYFLLFSLFPLVSVLLGSFYEYIPGNV